MIHKAIRAGFGAADFSGQQRIEAPLHIARAQRLAVRETNSAAQVKDIGPGIGIFKALGQFRADAQALVPIHQVLEQQSVNPL